MLLLIVGRAGTPNTVQPMCAQKTSSWPDMSMECVMPSRLIRLGLLEEPWRMRFR